MDWIMLKPTASPAVEAASISHYPPGWLQDLEGLPLDGSAQGAPLFQLPETTRWVVPVRMTGNDAYKDVELVPGAASSQC